MKLKNLPIEIVEKIHNYIYDSNINYKKVIRCILFLRYKYEFDLYFKKTDLEFSTYILNNKIFI